jgi:hypothetical protein
VIQGPGNSNLSLRASRMTRSCLLRMPPFRRPISGRRTDLRRHNINFLNLTPAMGEMGQA